MAFEIIMVSRSFVLLFGFFILFLILKSWKADKNPFDLGIFAIVLSYILLQIFGGIEDSYTGENFDQLWSQLTFGSYLTAPLILYGVFIIIFGMFVLKIFNFRLIMSLPFVIVFFIEVYIYFEGVKKPLIDFIIILLLLSVVFLLYNSIKYRNGITFSLSLAAAIVIPDFIFGFIALSYIAGLPFFISIYLGVSGWFDKKIFYDRKKRAEIQNKWISRIVK